MAKAKKENAKSSKADKILTIIFTVICVILIGFLAWFGIDKFILKNPVQSIGPYAVLRVATGSMTPTICENDLIVIKDTGDYGLRDIITFMPTGDVTPTTHRIIRYDDNGDFITKGDFKGNSEDDEHIKTSQVLGEVVLIIRTTNMSKWFVEMGWVYLLAMGLIVAMGVMLLKYDQSKEASRAALAQDGSAEQGTDPENNTENDIENNSETVDEAEVSDTNKK